MTQLAIVPTAEQTAESKRHPWTCQNQIGKPTRRCNAHNLARNAYCCSCGAPYHQERGSSYEPDPTLAARVTVTEAVEEWQALEEEIKHCFDRLSRVEERLAFLFEDEGHSFTLRDQHNHRGVSFEDVGPVLEQARRSIWRCLMDKLEVQRFVSDQRWAEILKQLDKDELPDITPQNVDAWRSGIMGSMDDLLREKVTEVFNYLRPRHDHFKTNKPFELGSKVILEYCVDCNQAYCTWRPKLRYDRQQMWRSIESLFRTLDGKGNSTQGHQSDVERAIATADIETGRCETEYFKLRACRKGTLHVEFKRADIVAKLNAMAGGKNLRGHR